MKSLPLISVVVITYGQEKYLEQTLKGIIEQNINSEVEVIIAEDFSPDDSYGVFQRFVANNQIPSNFAISYTRHSKNMGAINNFLWALEKANGQFIAICEGDDFWIDPDKLALQIDALRSNENAKICCTNYYELRGDTRTKQNSNVVNVTQNYTFVDLLGRNMIATLTAVFVNPGQDFWNNFRRFIKSDIFFMGDYPLWLMLLSIGGEIVKLPHYTAVYRVLNESASHSSDLQKKIQFEKNVLMVRAKALEQSPFLGNKILKGAILNNSYTVLAMYKHADAVTLRSRILNDLRKDGLNLTMKNRIKKAWCAITGY